MTKALSISLFLSFTFVLEAQEVETTKFYKDFTGNGEVFFNAVVSEIQAKNLGINDSTFWYLDSALAYYKSDACKKSNVFAVKARMFYEIEKYDSATLNFIKASTFLSPKCLSFNRYYLYNSWSLLTKSIDEYESSDSLNALAYKAALDIEDPTYQLYVLVNKSLLLSDREDYKMAIHIMKHVYKQSLELDIRYLQLVSLQNLGAFYIDFAASNNAFEALEDSAFYVYEKLGKLVNNETPARIRMDMMNNLGLIYFHRTAFDKAENLFNNAVELARENDERSRLVIYYGNLAELNFAKGDYKASHKYLAQATHLKDSLFNVEKFEILKDLETQYKTTKQREKIFELEKRTLEQELSIATESKRTNGLFFVVGALLLIVIAALSRLNYVRKSKRIVEREKKRSDDLLLNILPEEVAEELKNTGKSEARSQENVTVLFSDFVDFTSAAEKYSPQELVHELNFFFESFDNIITKHNVEKIKTIGDSYMAASGVPLPNPDSAKTMILVALEMMRLTQKRNEKNKVLGKATLDMRIGINTGAVVAGIVGVKKFQFDIWGDTVNIASRMESNSEVNRINISQSTYDLVKNEAEFTFEKRGLIATKGKGKIEMYFVNPKS